MSQPRLRTVLHAHPIERHVDRVALMRCALLVDDEQTVRTVLRRYLEHRGWSILEAASAESALQLLGDPAVRVDAVVVDLHLPGLSGGALCRRISTMRPALRSRMVMASGDALAAVTALAGEALHCPVLSKPFDLLDLVRVLDRVAAAA